MRRAVLLAACLLATPAAAEPLAGLPLVAEAPALPLPATAASRERLFHLFADGVLRSEDGREAGIVKWTGRVDVSLRGPAASRYEAFVTDLVEELAGLTGLAMELSTDSGWAGQIDIVLLNRADFWPPEFQPRDPARRGRFVCAALPLGVAGRMRRAQIVINEAALDPATVEACLTEELAQSMGLVGEVVGDRETLLSDEVGFRALTPTDRVLLRALYDPTLPPGAPRAMALGLLPSILTRNLAAQACPSAGCAHALAAR
jgi:hypothetical protein